jgi:4-methylaminobutanoate oxidase (formaldehyde-forming)
VDERYIAEGRFALDVGGERVPARASLAAPYDPRGVRIKG